MKFYTRSKRIFEYTSVFYLSLLTKVIFFFFNLSFQYQHKLGSELILFHRYCKVFPVIMKFPLNFAN